ncbi:FKBP-type peptidyl-prolyl cis-trans isomerase [Taibaiella soli]|uniref:Peptidyl-prolyl cis-trans isomerase n=1 Tax=Taibaiella soli TaxID=1649169 RepID=A0A2W2BEC4_9BACT|nr:FKBP-type peptidyl-prolyl cis-trans isomerase [Taibaiella soli]PZF74237.1 FKBP-type peptidylprolyl isomerase [Taibaiella soli]
MKKILLPALVAIGAAVMGSCNKTENTACPVIGNTAPQTEIDSLTSYLKANNITDAKLDSRGFYYTILDSGSTPNLTACNTAVFDYIGKLTDANATVFDQEHGITLDLVNLINGWREGLPYIGIGGRITLYIPPSLGYGSTVTGIIPANGYLVFTISAIQLKS